MTPPEPRAPEEPVAASDAGESDAAAESPTSQRPADAELEADLAADEGGSEAVADSPTEQPLAEEEAEADAASEAVESEALTESPTEQPVEEEAAAEEDAAVVAEVGAVAPAAETVVEEVPIARRRSARAPAWAWVAITLMALLLISGLITLAIARNANPSTPEAVEDVQTLVVELEALNGYLATTNELMSNAIASAEQLNATAQAKLAGLSAQVADADAGVGHARSLLGDQLSETTRTDLDKGQEQLQSLRETLAERIEESEQQLLAAISGASAGLDDRVSNTADRGSNRAQASEARIAALEGRQAATDASRAQLRAEADRRRAEAELLRVAILAQRDALQAQRERAQELAAQIRELRRTVAVLRRIVDRVSSRPR